VNLSLENNIIRDKKEIGMIVSQPDKMPHLRELILIGNPVREQAYKLGTGGKYRRYATSSRFFHPLIHISYSEMVRRFPSLTILDKEVISQISFDSPQSVAPSFPVEKPNATSFPFEMGPSFITGVDGSLVSNFLVRLASLVFFLLSFGLYYFASI
jgi:nuclear RNA export factor